MKRLAVPSALIAASAVLALLAFEILLRAIGFSAPSWYRPDPQLGWTLRPGIAAWSSGESRSYVQINPQGRRDRGYPLHKPKDAYRIAVLGDSYAEAMQVEREQAFWALLPERLARCGFQPGERIEVLNFGVSGYGTAQEYVVLESTAMRYHPDLVLLQFTNGNDVRNNSFALEAEKLRPFFIFEPDGALRIDESFATSPGFRGQASFGRELLRRASDRSRVLQLARAARAGEIIRKAHAAGAGVEQGLEPVVLAAPRERLWDEAWRITEALIAKTADYAARNGARFVVVTVPYAIQVHPDRSVREALQARLGVPDLFYPDRRIAALAASRGLLAVPLAPELQRLAEESGTYFHGFANVGMGRGHWNATGHSAAADIIARRLCEARWP
jgi:hypothetical protein